MQVSELVPVLIAAAVGAAFVCYLFVRYEQAHLHLTGDAPDGQPQKAHTVPVPRIGGIGVLAGLLLGGGVAILLHNTAAVYFWLMMLAAVPAYGGGLVEDFTRSAHPVIRLLLTLVTATVAFIWLDAGLYRSDVWWLDAAFRFWPLSLAGTLFAIGGLAHAMNIIDGSHGLCAGVAVMIFCGLAAVAMRVGADDLALASVIGACGFFGFLMLNYPFGRIFLGDGGAYLAGILIGVIAARLVGQHTQVSPWFPFVLVVYPVWETLFSALRRLSSGPAAMGRPDALHLHSMIRRRLREALFRGHDEKSLQLSNAFTAVPLWLIEGVMVAGALRWYDSTHALVTLSLLFVPGYCLVYWAISRFETPPHTAEI